MKITFFSSVVLLIGSVSCWSFRGLFGTDSPTDSLQQDLGKIQKEMEEDALNRLAASIQTSEEDADALKTVYAPEINYNLQVGSTTRKRKAK